MSQAPPPVNLQIDPKIVESIVRSQIQAAIVAQFNKTPDMVESLVGAALKVKVNKSGHISSSDYENRFDMVEALSVQAINECAVQAARDWVNDHKPEITKAIRNHFSTRKNELVKKFVDAAEKALSPDFYVSCTLKPKE